MVSRVVVKIKQDNGEERVLGTSTPILAPSTLKRKQSKAFL